MFKKKLADMSLLEVMQARQDGSIHEVEDVVLEEERQDLINKIATESTPEERMQVAKEFGAW